MGRRSGILKFNGGGNGKMNFGGLIFGLSVGLSRRKKVGLDFTRKRFIMNLPHQDDLARRQF